MKKVDLGRVVMTAGVDQMLKQNEELIDFVYSSVFRRFQNADWGEMCEEDERENDLALEFGYRLLGSYVLPKKFRKDYEKIWVITEWDRSVTTILLPEEY